MSEAIDHPHSRRALVLLAAIAVMAVLRLGRELLIPLALAAFLSFLLAPVVSLVERARLGRVVSSLLVVAAVFVAIVALGWLVAAEAADLGTDMQRYRGNISAKARGLQASIRDLTEEFYSAIGAIREEVGETQPATQREAAQRGTDAADTAAGPAAETGGERPAGGAEAEPVPVEVVRTRETAVSLIRQYLMPVMHPLATAGLTLVFVVFFLIYRADLRDRIMRLCGRAQINVTTTALVDTAQRVMRYVAAQAAANAMIGVAVALGLYVIGIPNAALWGVLAAVLRFIPYIGASIAALFPVAQALAIFDGWLQPLLVLGWTLLVDVTSANVLEPWLFGRRTGASPPALLFAFVLWTWMWGGVGLLLATPITVCLIVLGKHIPAFETFYVIFGDEPVLEPRVRLYQRLLAGDRTEAIRVARRHAEETSVMQALDEVILPALAELERDRQADLLDAARVESARNTVRELVDSLLPEERAARKAVQPQAGGAPAVLAVLNGGVFDEFLPVVLARTAELASTDLGVMSGDTLVSEIIPRIREARAQVVVLGAIEPRDGSRFRQIAARLAAEGIRVPVYLALITAGDRGGRTVTRASTAGLRVFTSMANLAEQLNRLARKGGAPTGESKRRSSAPRAGPAYDSLVNPA